MSKTRQEARERRKRHIRKNISGTSECPRLVVFRSNRYLSAQAVDDVAHTTITAISEKKLKTVKDEKPVERAARLGGEFGKVLKKKKIETVVFDRGGYKYHGRVKAFADGVRQEGINF